VRQQFERSLYLRAGNEKEAGIIDRFELKNLANIFHQTLIEVG